MARKEIAHYQTQQNRFGLPLGKSLAISHGIAEDFDSLIDQTYKFGNESPSRVPLTDWYWTQDARQRGFQAWTVAVGHYSRRA